MRRITSLKTAAAALLIGSSLALAPEARAQGNVQGQSMNGVTLNGVTSNGVSANGSQPNGFAYNGMTLNGMTLNGMTLNGSEPNGSHPQGRPARDEAADLGALHVRAIRLPDGRTLLFGQR